jgi:tetratricopeptide (TPR) repeat protein
VKVELALRILPEIEGLAPLRALLLSSARAPDDDWGSGAPYRTIGRREAAPEVMRQSVAEASASVRAHLGDLWERYISALEHIDNQDTGAAIAALLENGRREQEAGRLAQARAWFQSARTLAEGLQDRKPEIEAQLALGELALFLGFYEDAAREFQRALVLAESEFDQTSAIRAAKGLGDVAVERAAWTGARAWYARALRLADAMPHARWAAQLHHASAELARRMGDLNGASVSVRDARERFETFGDGHELARVLTTQGLIEGQQGLHARASAALVEALAWVRSSASDPGLEVFIRIHIARMHVEQRRYLEAEEELRRAEDIAIGANLLRRLAEIYSLLGTARGEQGDETAFVFFEQALEIARMLERWPIAEAQVRYEYGRFRERLGGADEAFAHFERAREIFESLGASAELERVRFDLRRLSA